MLTPAEMTDMHRNLGGPGFGKDGERLPYRSQLEFIAQTGIEYPPLTAHFMLMGILVEKTL